MLVLSRKQGESIEFKELDVIVRVISLKRSKVQLGIDAPRHIRVDRSEIASENSCDASNVAAVEYDRIRDELVSVQAELAALAELADADSGSTAQRMAADSIERIDSILGSLRTATRERSEPRPISDFVKVRAEVLEDLRKRNANVQNEPSDRWQVANDHPTCVRQPQAVYTAGDSAISQESCVA